MTQALVNGVVITIANNTPYAVPVGPYRVYSLLELEYSTEVDGTYTTLVGANSDPGARVSGGFIRCPTVFTPLILKKIETLSDSYAAEVSRSGPISYHRFNEQQGSIFYDSIDRDFDLTIAAGVTLAQEGPLGDGSFAALFNGTTGQGSTSSGVNPWFHSEALSFEAWVYNAAWSGSHEMIICCGAAGIYMSVVNAKLIMSLDIIGEGQKTSRTLVSLPTGAWTHVAVTWESGDRIRLYVNGLPKTGDVLTAVTGELETSAELYIGSFGGFTLFNDGYITQPAVYLRKLTAEEVLLHYGARANQ